MKTVWLSIILLCCAFAGCDGPDVINDGGIEPAEVIKAANVDVSADTKKAVFDRPITITTRCMPLITGKGVIGLYGWKSNGNVTWTLESPAVDTVTTFQESSYTIYVPAEFKANNEFEQKWTVHLVPPSAPNYLFGAHAHIDSIFIADSNKMYWINSEVARKYCPRPRGWQPDAVSSTEVYLDL
jgi:hypothetical protein